MKCQLESFESKNLLFFWLINIKNIFYSLFSLYLFLLSTPVLFCPLPAPQTRRVPKSVASWFTAWLESAARWLLLLPTWCRSSTCHSTTPTTLLSGKSRTFPPTSTSWANSWTLSGRWASTAPATTTRPPQHMTSSSSPPQPITMCFNWTRWSPHENWRGSCPLFEGRCQGGGITMVTSGCTAGEQPVLMNVFASWGSLSESLATEQRWRERGGHICHVKGEGKFVFFLTQRGELTDGFTFGILLSVDWVKGGRSPISCNK